MVASRPTKANSTAMAARPKGASAATKATPGARPFVCSCIRADPIDTLWCRRQREIAVAASGYELEQETVADAFDVVVAPDFSGELAAVFAGEEFAAGVGRAVDDVNVAAVGLPAGFA